MILISPVTSAARPERKTTMLCTGNPGCNALRRGIIKRDKMGDDKKSTKRIAKPIDQQPNALFGRILIRMFITSLISQP